MKLLIILGVLFLALFLVVPLLEKRGKRHSPEELQKLTKWFGPLILILVVAQLVKALFFD